jgi:hypothetical protein
MRSFRLIPAATLIVWTGGLWGGAVLRADDAIPGEKLDPATYGHSYIESMQEAIERDRSNPAPKPDDGRNGQHGVWMVPSRGGTTAPPHSGDHYVTNKWGDTLMGIGFPGLVDVQGAYFAGQAESEAWTTGVRAVGWRDGEIVQTTEWFQDITGEPRWFAMCLEHVDRIQIESAPVFNGGGWYSMDDLTFQLVPEDEGVPATTVVVDFDDLSYNFKLTGTNYADLTWETGMGEFPEGGVHGPMSPEGAKRPGGRGGEEEPLLPPRFAGTPPTLVSSFQSVIRGDAGSMSYPPDTDGAIGPNHYVETVNRNFAIYEKVGGAEQVNILLGSFLPGSNGDPRVLFDHHSGRWIVIVTDFSSGSNIYLAVSLTNDPNGSWFKTSFYTAQSGDAGKWPDYPTLGVDANGIYTTAYMVGGANGMTIFAIDKAPLIAPSPSLGTITAFRNLPWEGAIQPAHTYGTPAGEYLVSNFSSTALRVRRVNPPLSSPTLTEVGTVTVPAFSDPPNAPALGSGTPLNTVDDRQMMAVYRDGSIWSAHTISASGRAACRWYQLNASPPSLIQSGTVADVSLYYYFPSIMVNQYGHVVMGFTGSNASQYAACYYTGRVMSDALGEMAQPVMYKAGTGPQNNVDGYGRNRWGDYSYTTLDPVDQATFWTIQEYGHATDLWGTYVAVLTQGPHPPGAVNLNATTPVSTPVPVSLQATDDGQPNPPGAMTYIITSLPGHGNLSDPGAGTISSVPYTLVGGGHQVGYQPQPEYRGPDGFQFKANDGGTPPQGGDSNLATVSITVGGPAWDPVAQNMNVNLAMNTPSDIALNGTDPNGDPLTYVVESLPPSGKGLLFDPASGQITTVPHVLAGGGSVVRYYPPFGRTVVTSFTFSVRDATAGSNVATVSVTVGNNVPRVVYGFALNSDPGWAREGSWAFGPPTGQGSHNGDPLSGYTGSNVYGYNLAGDYGSSIPVRYLTTTALDCTDVTGAELRFRRWLGVEGSGYDHASVQVSANGSSWTTVWQNGSTTISESSWTLRSYDISTVADGSSTVYVRWGMGPTDESVTYPGWNIDDVEVWGVLQQSCGGVLLGDVNLDGEVDGLDVQAFVKVLLDPYSPIVTFSEFCAADLDQDGFVTPADIAGFVGVLLGAG